MLGLFLHNTSSMPHTHTHTYTHTEKNKYNVSAYCRRLRWEFLQHTVTICDKVYVSVYLLELPQSSFLKRSIPAVADVRFQVFGKICFDGVTHRNWIKDGVFKPQSVQSQLHPVQQMVIGASCCH